MKNKLTTWFVLISLVLLVPAFSFAETDVADYAKGGAIELVAGKFNTRSPLENMLAADVQRTMCTINSFPGFTFRIRFFKELQIDRITILPWKSDANAAPKDILITTSSGKKIPATLTDTGWNHRNKPATVPDRQSIEINDKCSWIKIEIINA